MLRKIILSFIISFSVLLVLACKDNTLGAVYTVTYYADEAESGAVPATQTKEHGTEITLAKNPGSLFRTDLVLSGWNTSRNESGTHYELGANYTGNADLSLYAEWAPGSRIIYDPNGAAGIAPEVQSKVDDTVIALYDNAGSLVMNGYAFYGWNTEPDGSGTQYSPGTIYSANEELMLYAMWYDVNWARTVDIGISDSEFLDAASDSTGNVWAAGYQLGSAPFTYSGLEVYGAYNMGNNAVIVKYNSNGDAVLAKSLDAASNSSCFNSVAVDEAGNIYAAGYVTGTGDFDFGSGIITGSSAGNSSVLVKYNSSGETQWTVIVDGAAGCEFLSVEAAGGSVYAAGYQMTIGDFFYDTFKANGASAAENAVLVKYDSAGSAVWVMTTETGSEDYATSFESLALDSEGNIYTAGYKFGGPGALSSFGNGIAVDGDSSSNNALMVKYNPSGIPQLAVCPSSSGAASVFWGIAIDNSNFIYTAGYQTGNTVYEYSPGGASAQAQYAGGTNAVLVKWDADGNAVWAEVPQSGSDATEFFGVSTDGNSLWVSGYQTGIVPYDYNNGLPISGTDSFINPVTVKYSPDGSSVWAKTVSAAGSYAVYYNIETAKDGIVSVGSQNGSSDFIYGIDSAGANAAAAGANSGMNSLIVKYVK